MTRGKVEQWTLRLGLLALAVYTLGVVNSHTTALRQIGFHGALIAAAVAVWLRPVRLSEIAREPLALALAVLAVAGVASIAVSPVPGYSADEVYKEIGRLVLAAFSVAVLVRRGADARLLLVAAVAASWLVSLHDLLAYVKEAQVSSIWPSANIHKHRYFADPLLWFLPAALWVFSAGPRRLLPLLATGLLLYWLLLAGTGARAAWYGGVAASIVWFSLHFDRVRVPVAIAGLALAVGLGLWMLPDEIFWKQALRGIDTSHRMQGTWLPALTMIADQPWLGFGYGEEVFHAAYNLRAPAHPDWYFRTSVGPHNAFLAVWFAGGMAMLGALVAALVAFACIAWRVVRSHGVDPRWREPIVVAACSLLGYLIVRGSFETVGLTVTGLAFGLALSAALDRTPARDDGRQAGVVSRPADATAAPEERAAQRAEVD